MNIRLFKIEDLVDAQALNLQNIPENYSLRFWTYCLLTWPTVSFVAENSQGKLVGYVLSSVEGGMKRPIRPPRHGLIDSLSVSKRYRRGGVATRLMEKSYEAMADLGIAYVELSVRAGNVGAQTLYDRLGYQYERTVPRYYQNGEDAFIMRRPNENYPPPKAPVIRKSTTPVVKALTTPGFREKVLATIREEKPTNGNAQGRAAGT
ncbi:acyl-CoA N-acyltransferase [Hygrophoropsis aurantiaca]|uniref:Acyl-CoA N-acyltransferase n=1 Tax=Hygrophoropsis aurantiaca TaxID=72124 RepID=A0ACB8A4V2_9AGAM|nr:acyl-CoA N-acyltransferase [Hygrophoropsis aurantiaca]